MRTTHLRIVLGVTGSIAAYKMPQLVRMLCKREIEVKVILTENARGFVGCEALACVSGNQVYTDDAPARYDMDHIRLADWADFLVVCPASANTIAKINHGIADNLLTACALSFEKRLVIVPAMNTGMWDNTITRRNIATLEGTGAMVLPVDDGDLACGESGAGRLAPLEFIADTIASLKTPRSLAGKKILIAGGPTGEPIDDVRVITNRSSGAMSAAIAIAARDRGGQVTVVSGPAKSPLPFGVEVINVNTAREMLDAMTSRFDDADICIMAAAVSDFRPANPFIGKIHRNSKEPVTLELTDNPDILKTLGSRKKKQFLVGFALEEEDNVENAIQKMNSKNCDLMVLNRIAASLGRSDAHVWIVSRDKKPQEVPHTEKIIVAQKILDAVAVRIGLTNGNNAL